MRKSPALLKQATLKLVPRPPQSEPDDRREVVDLTDTLADMRRSGRPVVAAVAAKIRTSKAQRACAAGKTITTTTTTTATAIPRGAATSLVGKRARDRTGESAGQTPPSATGRAVEAARSHDTEEESRPAKMVRRLVARTLPSPLNPNAPLPPSPSSLSSSLSSAGSPRSSRKRRTEDAFDASGDDESNDSGDDSDYRPSSEAEGEPSGFSVARSKRASAPAARPRKRARPSDSEADSKAKAKGKGQNKAKGKGRSKAKARSKAKGKEKIGNHNRPLRLDNADAYADGDYNRKGGGGDAGGKGGEGWTTMMDLPNEIIEMILCYVATVRRDAALSLLFCRATCTVLRDCVDSSEAWRALLSPPSADVRHRRAMAYEIGKGAAAGRAALGLPATDKVTVWDVLGGKDARTFATLVFPESPVPKLYPLDAVSAGVPWVRDAVKRCGIPRGRRKELAEEALKQALEINKMPELQPAEDDVPFADGPQSEREVERLHRMTLRLRMKQELAMVDNAAIRPICVGPAMEEVCASWDLNNWQRYADLLLGGASGFRPFDLYWGMRALCARPIVPQRHDGRRTMLLCEMDDAATVGKPSPIGYAFDEETRPLATHPGLADAIERVRRATASPGERRGVLVDTASLHLCEVRCLQAVGGDGGDGDGDGSGKGSGGQDSPFYPSTGSPVRLKVSPYPDVATPIEPEKRGPFVAELLPSRRTVLMGVKTIERMKRTLPNTRGLPAFPAITSRLQAIHISPEALGVVHGKRGWSSDLWPRQHGSYAGRYPDVEWVIRDERGTAPDRSREGGGYRGGGGGGGGEPKGEGDSHHWLPEKETSEVRSVLRIGSLHVWDSRCAHAVDGARGCPDPHSESEHLSKSAHDQRDAVMALRKGKRVCNDGLPGFAEAGGRDCTVRLPRTAVERLIYLVPRRDYYHRGVCSGLKKGKDMRGKAYLRNAADSANSGGDGSKGKGKGKGKTQRNGTEKCTEKAEGKGPHKGHPKDEKKEKERKRRERAWKKTIDNYGALVWTSSACSSDEVAIWRFPPFLPLELCEVLARCHWPALSPQLSNADDLAVYLRGEGETVWARKASRLTERYSGVPDSGISLAVAVAAPDPADPWGYYVKAAKEPLVDMLSGHRYIPPDHLAQDVEFRLSRTIDAMESIAIQSVVAASASLGSENRRRRITSSGSGKDGATSKASTSDDAASRSTSNPSYFGACPELEVTRRALLQLRADLRHMLAERCERVTIDLCAEDEREDEEGDAENGRGDEEEEQEQEQVRERNEGEGGMGEENENEDEDEDEGERGWKCDSGNGAKGPIWSEGEADGEGHVVTMDAEC